MESLKKTGMSPKAQKVTGFEIMLRTFFMGNSQKKCLSKKFQKKLRVISGHYQIYALYEKRTNRKTVCNILDLFTSDEPDIPSFGNTDF